MVQSFVGCVNFLAKFLTRPKEILIPTRMYIQKDKVRKMKELPLKGYQGVKKRATKSHVIDWIPECEKAFKDINRTIS